ncbi:MAG TPA: DUF4846 domain-containing protein [Ignavibacteria bacterium]|nr:DUF4846 domain-containing protein [Ignavibacteria bacterium]HMR39341.1 DUF4846 domain-containing protein [Ignavibacteria bacterium]
MLSVKLVLFLVMFITGCDQNSGKEHVFQKQEDSAFDQSHDKNDNKREFINPSGKNILTRFITPEGYQRINSDTGSFGYYLQHFSLKKDGSKVYHYDGTEKANREIHAAVLDIDAGNKDLQQCADAIIRLRAEYLYEKNDFADIHFNFTNGFSADYDKWAEGYRIKVNGNKSSWYFSGEKDYSYGTFKNYLEMVFSYAGTISLSKELKSISENELSAGDVFIYGGSPGHAVLVVDVAADDKGQKIFLLAQSYMPAQDIHILVNPENKYLSPWYDLKDSDKLYTPEWTFDKTSLKRFQD